LKLFLLVLAIVVFVVTAVLCFIDPRLVVVDAIGVTCIGLGLLAASFLPIP
jgi:hypothetical protein